VDDLTRSFAVEAALRQIDDCSNIAELKALAKSLVKAHFEARDLIGTLLLRAPLPVSQDEQGATKD
jgi:hypothetical protein